MLQLHVLLIFLSSFHVLFILGAFTVQYAVHQTTSGGPGDNYYGLHVTTDVYSHNLKPGQQTSTAIWVNHVGDGVKSSLNPISIGWHVWIIFPF